MYDKRSTAKVLAVMLTIALFCLAFFGYKQYNEYTIDKKMLENDIDYLNSEKEIYFNSILQENKYRAENINNIIVKYIYDRLLPYYDGDTYALQYDISHPSSSSKLSELFDNIMEDVYVTKDNKYNTPFIMTVDNVVWNKSVSIVDEDSNALDNIIYYNYNYSLTDKAINALKSGNSGLIYWKINNDSYKPIYNMQLKDLYELYNEQGMESLKSYELLIPIYITDNGDIFNISDVDSLGHKNKNYKLILVQRVNIYDIFESYKLSINSFDSKIEAVETSIDHLKQRNALAMGEIIIMAVFLLIGTARYQKSKVGE